MADDLARKLGTQLADMEQRLQRMERRNPLEAASVTSGRLRFIGGTLRVDSGGRVEIVGSLQIEGTTDIIGPITIRGNLNVTGDWRFSGDGAITGDVVAEGKWTQNGEWEFNGPGDIDGDVDITGVLELLGGGMFKAGNVEISPSTSGGMVGFGGGRSINAGTGFLGVYDGSRFIVFNSGGVAINGGGGPTLQIGPNGILGVPTINLANAPVGSFVGAVVHQGGALYRVV